MKQHEYKFDSKNLFYCWNDFKKFIIMDNCVIDHRYAYTFIQTTWMDNIQYTVERCFNMKKALVSRFETDLHSHTKSI